MGGLATPQLYHCFIRYSRVQVSKPCSAFAQSRSRILTVFLTSNIFALTYKISSWVCIRTDSFASVLTEVINIVILVSTSENLLHTGSGEATFSVAKGQQHYFSILFSTWFDIFLHTIISDLQLDFQFLFSIFPCIKQKSALSTAPSSRELRRT